MPNGSHSNLLVFHQAISEQGRLWCGVTENHSWESDAPVPNTGMTASPAAVELNGKVYCFHQGFAANGTLYYNIYDGILWEGDRQVPATGMSEGRRSSPTTAGSTASTKAPVITANCGTMC